MEIFGDSYVNLKALLTFVSNIWYARIHLYLDKTLALVSQRWLIAVLSAHHSPDLGSTFHLDVVHRPLKDLATLTARGQLVSASIWLIIHYLHSQHFRPVIETQRALATNMVFSLTLFSIKKERIPIRLWKTSLSKSKTLHQKQRKSQGSSEAQGPTLGHLAIAKSQEPSVWAPLA